MNFFTAYKAVGADVHVPIYFIESTAPDNVDDTDELPTGPLPHLQCSMARTHRAQRLGIRWQTGQEEPLPGARRAL